MKEWVAAVYQTEAFNWLLKDALHPGGLAMTRRMVEVAAIGRGSTVLDIACGKGGTPILLGQEFAGRVIGIDLSPEMITTARNRSRVETPAGNVEFIVADAEEMPFRDNTFDVVISECSFSLLPDKKRAALEMSRVLKGGGKLVITDITIRDGMPDGEQGGFSPTGEGCPLLPCLAGAGSVADYVAILQPAGFRHRYVEDHSTALGKVAYQVVAKFGGWEGFIRQLSAELLANSNSRETAETRAGETLATLRKFGYALLMVSKG